MRTLKQLGGITESMKVKRLFEIVTLKMALLLGMSWQKPVVAWRTSSLKSAGNDSFKNAVEMLQPLLVAENHCPTGCPKVPAVRLAAMAPKMSKPAPPLPYSCCSFSPQVLPAAGRRMGSGKEEEP